MILERLVLENFRQFKGRQEIVFSDLREKNVTIVHAENGFGKTTLLNAILWALYGRAGLSEDFEKPDLLIHEGSAHQCTNPAILEAVVHLTFKHGNDRYILNRSISLAEQRSDPKKHRLLIEIIKDGQTFKEQGGVAQRLILSIVPDGIAQFLFFNGERIDHLAMEKNSAKVTEAIHQMLGLKLLRTTIDDLQHQNVRGKLLKELKDNTSDEKRELIARLQDAEESRTKLEEDQTQVRSNLKAIDGEIDMIDRKLAANIEARELQARRMRLQKEREELGLRREEIVKRLSKLIAEDGYTLFTTDLVARGGEIMKDLRERNMIPAPVIDTFLQELLDRGLCICERHLPAGSPEFEAVKQRLSVAPNQEFNNAVSALDHAIGLLEGVSVQTRDLIQQLNGDRLGLNTDIRNRDEEVAEIHRILGPGGKKDEDVQELEAARETHLLNQAEQKAKLVALGLKLEANKESIISLNAQIDAIRDQEEVAARAQRRVDAVTECTRVLQQILESETEELRPILNEEIASHFGKIIDREYWAELTPTYTLRIRKKLGGGEDGEESAEIDVALSTGQRQVTSLVFIASLLALARRRSEIPTILKGLSGNEYPLVTDSPFGQLSVFRWGVARWVPDLAPQVILFVSPKQFDGDVAEALRETGRIGKQYYLAYHGPSLSDRATPEMRIDGQPVKQYFPSEEERTEIMEVES